MPKLDTKSPEAFLSYTRLDDEYFGGAITSLRRMLELGVQVVTGDRTFNIFQDVEGIEFGQKWERRLTEAIATSRFLIPIVTPLFFSSDPCRDELRHFIEHEKDFGRDDMILPIYYVTTPLLERPELLREDELASEISSRQRCDWRLQADLSPGDPQIRTAVRGLALKIAAAVARTSNAVPAPSGPPLGNEPTARTPEPVGYVEPVIKIKRDRKLVLWVDDRPDNNIIERRALAAYDIDFVLALSTGEALAELSNRKFDAIVSDMGRPPDSQAGYTLLEAVRSSGNQVPYFIYAGSKWPSHVREAQRRGAQGTTDVGVELLQMLLKTINA